MKCPADYQWGSVWGKAYWNFTLDDWVNWLSSFATFPLKEFNNHIGNVINMYLPQHLQEVLWNLWKFK